MRTIAFPNGLSLTSSALSPQDIEQLFQIATVQIIGAQPGTVTTGTTVQDSSVLTVAAAGAIASGQKINAVGVPEGTTVVSIGGVAVQMSAPASASQSSTVAIGADDDAYYSVRVGWQEQGQPAFDSDEDVVTITAVAVDDPYNRIRDVASGPNDEISLLETTTFTRVWELRFSIYGPNSLDNARLIKSCLLLQWVHDLFAASSLYVVPDSAEPVRAPELFQGKWWERADFRARYNEFVTETIAQQTVASVQVVLDAAGPAPDYGSAQYGDGPYGTADVTEVDFNVSV